MPSLSTLFRTIECAPINKALRAFRKAKTLHLQMELTGESDAANRRSFETKLEDAIARRKKFGTHETREAIKEIEDDDCISFA